MATGSYSGSTLTISGAPLPAAIQPTDDFAIFAYYEPNAPGGAVCNALFVPAGAIAAARQFMATQTNPDGSPKYSDPGALVRANAEAGLWTQILQEFPQGSLLTALQQLQAAQAAAQTAANQAQGSLTVE